MPGVSVWVTERAAAKPLHIQIQDEIAKAKLIAKLAESNEWQQLLSAIDTQVREHVPWEAHAVRAGRPWTPLFTDVLVDR